MGSEMRSNLTTESTRRAIVGVAVVGAIVFIAAAAFVPNGTAGSSATHCLAKGPRWVVYPVHGGAATRGNTY
jgi:hypothetical protein